jgi:hypothetical protein
MKGIKRQDQAILIDLYKKMAPKENLADSQEFSLGVESPDGRIKKLGNLIF